MMTQSGLLIERVELGEVGTPMHKTVIAREIVLTDRGSVYELSVSDEVVGYLKLIISGETDAGPSVRAFAQKSRSSGRIFLGTDLDFSDAVDWALGAL
jgi:hypothetical protein